MTTETDLKDILQREAREFSFFQAVRMIQAASPDAAPVGTQGPPERERIRFKCDLGLGFPDSDITEIGTIDSPGGTRFEITTAFLGLYGSASPIPVFYTEDQIEQDSSDDSILRGVMDIFHHRLISLFYRVWEKYRYEILFRPGGEDIVSRRLLSMIGLGADLAPPRSRIPAVRMLAYTGLLTQQPRSASALRGILADYFDEITVAIEQCTGQKLDIAESQQVRLGSANTTLGRDASLGSRIFDRAATFRVSLGPVGLETFMSFIPPGPNTARLRELVDLVNGDGLDYELDVRLKRDEVPELKLSSDTARLGWSTWLGRKPEIDPSVNHLVKGRTHGQR